MTLETPLWLQNKTFTAQSDRRLIGAVLSAGVIDPASLKVGPRGAGTAMSVDVAAGTCVVDGTVGPSQGRYLCHSTAVTNLPITAAPTAGQSRIDLVVATVRDSAVAGGSDDWILQVVAGTPSAGTPAEPAVPVSSLVLAAVTVAGGAAFIGSSAITDRRVQAGTPANTGDLGVKPSFAGQIMGTDTGRLYVGAGGDWVWANKPVDPPAQKLPLSVYTTTGSWPSGWNSTSWAVLQSISVPASGWSGTAVVSGALTCAAKTGSNALANIRVAIHDGVAWRSGPSASVLCESTLSFRPVAVQHVYDISGSSTTQARLEIAAASGWIGMTDASLHLLVHPR